MDNIDCIYYINLDHRTDRNEQFLAEMKKMNIPESKVVRISGIYKEGFGILGCGLSHKKTVEMFLASDHRNCIIFEDDFVFTLEYDYINLLFNAIFESKVDFDLIMLAGMILIQELTAYPFLMKVMDGHTASAYLLTREFAPTLLESLTESTTLLEKKYKETGIKDISYHNDIYWKRYQPYTNWYIVNPKMGEQRESYSDNLERNLRYGF